MFQHSSINYRIIEKQIVKLTDNFLLGEIPFREYKDGIYFYNNQWKPTAVYSFDNNKVKKIAMFH